MPLPQFFGQSLFCCNATEGESLENRGVSHGTFVQRTLRPFREIDVEAMKLLARRSSDATPLKVDVLCRKLDKDFRRKRLYRGMEPAYDRWRLCEARMMLGDYSDWDGWEYRDPWVAGLWHNPGKFEIPPWDGVKSGRLFVFGEQGLGDEVFFASCLPDALRVCEVTLETEPRLIPAFERMGVGGLPSQIVESGGKRGRVQHPPEGDFWIPMGDLPRIFRHRRPFPDGPYLTADPVQVAKYAKYRGRVGISWRGAQGEYGWKEFSGLAENPLSLQYDNDWDSEVEIPEIDLKNDVEGILGLLMNLDRVITVSTTVAHLSCALGVRTEVILAPPNGRNANRIPWKWGLGDKSPWYGSSRVYQSLREYTHR